MQLLNYKSCHILHQNFYISVILTKEKFEDTKMVTNSCKPKERQYKVQNGNQQL